MKTKTLIAGAMLVGVGLWLAQPGFAAETATAPATQQAPTTVAYGFKYLLEGVLILMSVGGIALIIDAMIQIRESRIMPADVTEKIKTFIGARQYKELMEYTTAEQSFVAVALNAGLRRARQGFGGMRDGVETSAAEQSANWFRRIEFLNIIGNLGPLVGLMGTVLGMIIAFNELGDPNDASHMAQGAAKVARLAPGISRALAHFRRPLCGDPLLDDLWLLPHPRRSHHHEGLPPG